MRETMKFWKNIALRKPVATGIYCKAMQDGTFRFTVNVPVYVLDNEGKIARDSKGRPVKKFLHATCNTLEEARIKRKELQKQQKRKGFRGRTPKDKDKLKIVALQERIAQLEEELAEFRHNV